MKIQISEEKAVILKQSKDDLAMGAPEVRLLTHESGNTPFHLE